MSVCYASKCSEPATHIGYHLTHKNEIFANAFCEKHYKQRLRLLAYFPSVELAKVTRDLLRSNHNQDKLYEHIPNLHPGGQG